MSTGAASPPDSNLTWDEFLALPHELRNAALVDGEVVVNPPSALHELVVLNLGIAFRQWLREQPGRGDVSTQQPVKITDRRGYQPDFAWYPADRCVPPGDPRSFTPAFRGRPELVAEILSPSTRAFDLVRKRADYEQVGIGELWFVDTDERAVIACRRAEPGAPFTDREHRLDDTLTSRLLDGLTLPVAALFRY